MASTNAAVAAEDGASPRGSAGFDLQPRRPGSIIRGGASFLRKTQQEGGSWPVHGTKKDKRGRVEPTATYWGSCWAVLGLLETLPASEKR